MYQRKLTTFENKILNKNDEGGCQAKDEKNISRN